MSSFLNPSNADADKTWLSVFLKGDPEKKTKKAQSINSNKETKRNTFIVNGSSKRSEKL